MRLPERPPTLESILENAALSREFAAAAIDPKYVAATRRVDAKYSHWHRVQYIARADGLSPPILWALVKTARVSTARPLPLRGQGQNLSFNTPEVLQEELMRIDQQLAGRGAATEEQPSGAAQQERFIISALREEAIASSMLEGAATTRRDAKQMLESGRKPRTPGERMVANNYRAISFIREHKADPLTPEFLLTVQGMLVEGTLENEGEVGRFRVDSDNVRVTNQFGETLHTPPAAAELRNRLKALCQFANQGDEGGGGAFIHPVVRASIIHFQIGFDHPFCDGNGRTARAMFYWSMLRAGYWLFEYIPISRLIYQGPAKYAAAYLYTETDDFDVTYFLVYKARLIARARKELAEYIARQQEESAEAHRVVGSVPGLNDRQRDLISRVLRAPSIKISIHEHQFRHHVSYGSAYADLIGLCKHGYLTQSKVGKRLVFARGERLVGTAAESVLRKRRRPKN